MYSSACKAGSAAQQHGDRQPEFQRAAMAFRKAWWAMVMVTLELTSRMVLISGRPHGLMTSLGGGNSLGPACAAAAR
jgi:hypothetical protein